MTWPVRSSCCVVKEVAMEFLIKLDAMIADEGPS
jgi:hypothetical protein